jgi:CRP-like cAMP-binding protein
MGQRLASLGRRSAYEATAHLIMAIRTRLKQRGLVSDDKSFEIPLAQRDLADALGLSVVHINRILRRLDEDAVMTKTNRTVTIYDIDRLSDIAFAAFPE